MLRIPLLAAFAGTAVLCRAQAPAAPAAPAVGSGESSLFAPAPRTAPAALKAPTLQGAPEAAAPVQRPAPAPLSGQIEGNVYTAPNGAYSIASPVLPEFGGMVTDTGNVVTFQDQVSTVVSIATFPMNAGERWKLQLDGPKVYLRNFFNEYVLPDFQRAFPGVTVNNDATFMPNMLEGALLIFAELPGGSMFNSEVVIFDPSYKPRPAKRGNLIFLHNGYVFVISTELAERVIEGTAYTMTPEDENLELKERLEDTVNAMKFLRKAPQE